MQIVGYPMQRLIYLVCATPPTVLFRFFDHAILISIFDTFFRNLNLIVFRAFTLICSGIVYSGYSGYLGIVGTSLVGTRYSGYLVCILTPTVFMLTPLEVYRCYGHSLKACIWFVNTFFTDYICVTKQSRRGT